MRRVNAIVLYKELTYKNANVNYYTLEQLTVRFRDGSLCTLYSSNWDDTDRKHAYKYANIYEMHDSVLKWLKENNFYTTYRESFGGRLYDIYWIDLTVGETHTFYHN